MANETLTGTFTNIADAIRAKSGGSSPISPLNMGNEIRDLKDLTPASLPQSNLSAVFQDVADAIRECGVSGTMTPLEMPTKIGSIVVDTGDWLCFTANEAGSTIHLDKNGTPDAISLETSTDGTTWTDYGWNGNTGYTLTMTNIGDKVYMRAKNENTTIGSSTRNYYKFTGTGSFAASGNIQSFLKSDCSRTDAPSYCYYKLFYACRSLTTAPTLPATTLADYCYNLMFQYCSSLTTAPTLPATTLANHCYDGMFQNCTGLTSAPELPVTTLANYCYANMFRDCTSLTSAPVLSATTLTERCYYSMFNGCTSLTAAPELPATTLANYCYYSMFSGCTSLTTAPELPATTLTIWCYYSMFQNCTSLTAAPVLPATTLTERCYNQMFIGCTSLTTAPALPATTLADYCYSGMFNGCTNLSSITLGYTGNFDTKFNNWVNGVAASGTFYYNGSDTTRGTSAIPENWTITPFS